MDANTPNQADPTTRLANANRKANEFARLFDCAATQYGKEIPIELIQKLVTLFEVALLTGLAGDGNTTGADYAGSGAPRTVNGWTRDPDPTSPSLVHRQEQHEK